MNPLLAPSSVHDVVIAMVLMVEIVLGTGLTLWVDYKVRLRRRR